MNWTHEEPKRPSPAGVCSNERWFGSGRYAGNMESSGKAEIEVKKHWNGSGLKSFGGADSWPVVESKASFVTGQEQEAREFALALKEFIHAYFTKS